MNNSEPIILSDDLFIGEGRNRKCYVHPQDNSLCIKIAYAKAKRSVQREIAYFKRLRKKGKSFEMISKHLGKVQTNRGEGELYELVRDVDGNISKNLRYYLSNEDQVYHSIIVNLVEKLRVYLKRENVLFSDLDIENILLKKESETKYALVVVDGIGHNNQIPFLEFLPTLAMKRSIRKWETFRMQFINEFSYKEIEIKRYDK